MTALNTLSKDWRDWVLVNVGRSCTEESMLKHMLPLFTHDQALKLIREARECLFPAFFRPLISVTKNQILLGDIVASVAFRLANPHIVVIDNVLTALECDQLMTLAIGKNLSSSTVVHTQTGESVLGDYRTSSGCFFSRSENELVAKIERRLSSLNRCPIQNGEGIQVLKYEVGQQYKPHFDYFDPKNPGSVKHLNRGGQRVGTFVIYLSEVEEGGSTFFPELGLDVFPRKGSAVYFSSVDSTGKPCTLTRHAGSPVISGVKSVATYWQRERAYT
ncbi:MAG: 2OG-Fe(II) oxygenase [Methylobacter sp.]